MNERLKMLIAFQALPVTFFISLLIGVVAMYTAGPDPRCGPDCFMAMAIPHDLIWKQFWQGMEIVLFFFVGGIPFTFMIFYWDDLEKKRQRESR